MRLIDTSILIDFFLGVPRVKDLMCDDEPVISMVSVHEIFTGFKYINNNSTMSPSNGTKSPSAVMNRMGS